jgi:hypothetical protein
MSKKRGFNFLTPRLRVTKPAISVCHTHPFTIENN